MAPYPTSPPPAPHPSLTNSAPRGIPDPFFEHVHRSVPFASAPGALAAPPPLVPTFARRRAPPAIAASRAGPVPYVDYFAPPASMADDGDVDDGAYAAFQ